MENEKKEDDETG